MINTSTHYDNFKNPLKIYERDLEIFSLHAAFEETCTGVSKFLLITGPMGIGKSRLITELQKRVVEKNGYFIYGKFEQFKQHIPYFAIIQSFNSLIELILKEDKETLDGWQDRLEKTLGSNGQIITDLFPKLEFIIGKQEPVVPLPPNETEARFNYIFSNFLSVLLQPGVPLTLVLDDLQWADDTSLRIIKDIACNPSYSPLLVIGAYRNNEVDIIHPLAKTLQDIECAGKKIDRISLIPLERRSISDLICDRLNCSKDENESLVDIIYDKTKGNPFFVTLFLRRLSQMQLITFDKDDQKWTICTELIERVIGSEDVEWMLIQQILELPKSTQQLLTTASAIGYNFDLQTLACAAGISSEEAFEFLFAALKEDLIIVENEGQDQLTCNQILYSFQHDRIQQTAYQLIDPLEKEKIHYNIAQAILKNTSRRNLKIKCIIIASQFNRGLSHVVTSQEKYEVAFINFLAGQRAKDTIAISTAIEFFEKGTFLLSDRPFENHYELACELYEGLYTCNLIIGRVEEAETIMNILLENAVNDFERARHYVPKILLYVQLGRNTEALNLGLIALRLLGVKISPNPTQYRVLFEMVKLKFRIKFTHLDKLAYSPEVKDPKILLINRLLGVLSVAAFLLEGRIGKYILLKSIHYSFDHGITAQSSYGIAAGSLILCSESVGDYRNSIKLGQVALTIAERYPKNRESYQANGTVYASAANWYMPYRDLIKLLKGTSNNMLELGNMMQASCYLHLALNLSFLCGIPLNEFNQDIQAAKIQYQNRKEGPYLYRVLSFEQFCRSLQGKTSRISTHHPDHAQLESLKTPHHIWIDDVYKLVLHYYNDEFDDAITLSRKWENNRNVGAGLNFWHLFYFYQALSIASMCRSEDKILLRELHLLNKRIAGWAHVNPHNFLNKSQLISAEVARLNGQYEKAFELYDKAAQSACKSGFLHEQAIAYEYAGILYHKTNKRLLAATFIQAACRTYAGWGAYLRVKKLKERFSELF